MEKKHYHICTYDGDQYRELHDELMQSTSGLANIPDRECDCTDEKLHSCKRGVFLLTEDEANALDNDERVQGVFLDPGHHPEILDDPVLKNKTMEEQYESFQRYTKTVKNYRDWNAAQNLPLYPNETDHNRAGYQLLRCMSKNDPWLEAGQPSSFVYNSNISQIGDGMDVDIVVSDNGVWIGHPEFQNNCPDPEQPANYVGGNKLPGNGTCDVLDLLLDGPYYLDPDFFDADPGNRLTTRFDGTTVPVESFARSWWKNTSNRSSTYNTNYPSAGTVSFTSDYTRAHFCGSNTTQANEGKHGTPCAALAYGRTQGWAYNANKWSLACLDDVNGRSPGTEVASDIQKIFHTTKPINSKYGTRDPTVSTNSWGNSYYWRPGLPSTFPDTWYYTFRDQNIKQSYTSESQVGRWLTSLYNSVKQLEKGQGMSDVQALNELVDSGVIFFCSSGNSNQKQVLDGHPDYNNYISPNNTSDSADDAHFASASWSYKGTTNRRGYPQQGGRHTDPTTGKIAYKTISVGALDDEFTFRGGSDGLETTDVDPISSDPFDEPFDNYGEDTSSAGGAKERKVIYSNKGNGVDFYTPANGTLAATNKTSAEISSSRRAVYPNGVYPGYNCDTTPAGAGKASDGFFSGTSAACPVAAGFFATLIGKNRNWTYKDVQNFIANLSDSDPEFFYAGRESTTRNDTNWSSRSIEGGRPLVPHLANVTFTTPPTGVPEPPTPPNPPGNQQSLSGASNLFIDNRLKMRNIIVR